MRIPTYHDGKPTNLQAAILDAMYWLRLLRSRLYDEPQLPLTEQREHQAYLRLAIQALQGFLPPDDKPCGSEDDQNGLPPMKPTTGEQAAGGTEVKQGLTPVQQAKFDLIKAKLGAKQQAMREMES